MRYNKMIKNKKSGVLDLTLKMPDNVIKTSNL